MDRWKRADEIIDRVEQTLIAILLSLMIFIAFLQIVLRNVFATGLSWGDPLVRNLVLWVGFIGAAIAAREGKHINIYVVSQWMPLGGKGFIEVINQLFSFFICGLLTFAALKFIKNEAQMGSVTFLGIPAWIPQIILPITFGLMAFRFGLHSFKNLSAIVKIGTDLEGDT
ncbi:MAG: TRAP transporter small permease [Deltaproteobacteria bacterium]|nr:TRAP transporter small permease [Deltaproteobacteria bacterium]